MDQNEPIESFDSLLDKYRGRPVHVPNMDGVSEGGQFAMPAEMVVQNPRSRARPKGLTVACWDDQQVKEGQ